MHAFSRWRRVAFAGVLVAAMASATFLPAALGIVASALIDDLDVSRTAVGGLITATIVVAALASPRVGRVTDIIGGRFSVALVFAAAVVGFVGVAVSPIYWIAYIPVIVAAVGQAAGNPATNKLIALHAEPGRRGVITGVKQSGVQAGIFLGGFTVPALVAASGWRWALAIVAIVPLVGLMVTFVALPGDVPFSEGRVRDDGGSLPGSIRFLALYGGLMGFGAAYTFLVPLYIEEVLGRSKAVGGLAVGLVGLVSLFGRIAWARYSESSGHFVGSLVWIAGISVFGVVFFALAEPFGWGLIWIGVAITGVSSSSWNSVGMLAVIHAAGEERAGRASGVVMLGFLTGLGVAPTVLAWTVDQTGSYVSMWALSALALAASFVVALRWQASHPATA